MTGTQQFLADLMPRHWKPEARHHFQAAGLFIGNGSNAIEVAVAQADAAPSRKALLDSWKTRRAGRATPVLLVVLYPSGTGLCGASGEEPPVYPNVENGQAERLCREVLNQPDRHAALRFLTQALSSLGTALPGINNEGLVAIHELAHGAPKRVDWEEARHKAAAALNRRDRDLLSALGFQIEPLDNLTSLLRSGDRRTALAVMLRETEPPEAGAVRFNNLSPVSYALAKADAENLSWVVLVQGNQLRLYSTAVDAGVGRRGRTETYIECQPSLLSDRHLPYLWLLYSAEALAPKGSLSQILDDSERFAGDLAGKLRERIYDTVMPILAQGIGVERATKQPGPAELEHTYEMALTVLFRLLFIAYAEDRDLLPYRFNDAYRRRSLKQKAQELADCVANETPITDGHSHWQEVSLLWEAVAGGNRAWGVPAYDGGLFTNDANVSQVGAELAHLVIPNATFEAALRALLVIETAEGVPGPIDFRSLGVREFGTIYEGLLESELALASADLTLNRKGAYVPAQSKDPVAVEAGEIYLHNRSGVRKSSGSYYTKHFAVEHLLDGALEPALTDHFARLDEMNDIDAAEAFFDFRIADIAMGSGHFLIAAIDRIEKGMADFLTRRNLQGVQRELAGLREAAMRELRELAETGTIEDGQLLRRLIARRCIYGVDLNALSVHLSRLAVWIHTFVPGLPLSVLDHTLVHGNSLVGIGTVEDIRKKFESATGTIFEVNVKSLLGAASAPLQRLAKINDATLQDIAAVRMAIRETQEAVGPTEALCDLIAAGPISTDEKVIGFPFEDWEKRKDDPETHNTVRSARKDLENLHALHFPVAFPEVFLRQRPGFDVILGNPPWESPTTHEVAFWARYFPGLRGLSQQEAIQKREQLKSQRPDLVSLFEDEVKENNGLRKALVGGAYPGMGTGDPDLYKAFCWRFWHLTATEGGRIGVVLPRSVLAAKGSTEFRLAIFKESSRVGVDMLLNRGGWVFDEAEHRYTIGLVCAAHGAPEDRSIHLRGPFSSLAALADGIKRPAAAFDRKEVLAWNDFASLPLFPSENSADVFAQLRKAPRLDLDEDGQWRARPYGESHSKKCKEYLLPPGTKSDAAWPVFKGKSFNLDNPDTGEYYGFALPNIMCYWLDNARKRQVAGSAYSEFTKDWAYDPDCAPWLNYRVAYRDVTNRTNQRTVITTVVPPKVFLTDKAPYFLFSRGKIQDQAFLYGILRSIPLDWFARRHVETGVKFYLICSFPIPRPTHDDIGRLRVVEIAARLASPDSRFADWAEANGVAYGPLPSNEKDDMIHELDAVVAHLYGLSEAQLVHIFETFHQGWDYQDRLDDVLRYYSAWAGRR